MVFEKIIKKAKDGKTRIRTKSVLNSELEKTWAHTAAGSDVLCREVVLDGAVRRDADAVGHRLSRAYVPSNSV